MQAGKNSFTPQMSKSKQVSLQQKQPSELHHRHLTIVEEAPRMQSNPLIRAGAAAIGGSFNTVARREFYGVEVKDDEMPQIPTLSLHVAQHDIKHEREMFHKNLEMQNNTFMRLFAE